MDPISVGINLKELRESVIEVFEILHGD